MPVHDWSEIDANVFHDFHQAWAMEIRRALNEVLPPGFSALVEQRTPNLEPDVLALERRQKPGKPRRTGGGTATLERPSTRFSEVRKDKLPAERGNRVVIRHKLGDIVCVIEIVSPGNKRGRKALAQFVEKAQDFLASGIHLLVLDILPPNKLTPTGLHPLIWDDEHNPEYDPTPDEPLTFASYRADIPRTTLYGEAFLERIAVGGVLPAMPAFIEPDQFVNVPLETTYMKAWESCPRDMQYYVKHRELPED